MGKDNSQLLLGDFQQRANSSYPIELEDWQMFKLRRVKTQADINTTDLVYSYDSLLFTPPYHALGIQSLRNSINVHEALAE